MWIINISWLKITQKSLTVVLEGKANLLIFRSNRIDIGSDYLVLDQYWNLWYRPPLPSWGIWVAHVKDITILTGPWWPRTSGENSGYFSHGYTVSVCCCVSRRWLCSWPGRGAPLRGCLSHFQLGDSLSCRICLCLLGWWYSSCVVSLALINLCPVQWLAT